MPPRAPWRCSGRRRGRWPSSCGARCAKAPRRPCPGSSRAPRLRSAARLGDLRDGHRAPLARRSAGRVAPHRPGRASACTPEPRRRARARGRRRRRPRPRRVLRSQSSAHASSSAWGTCHSGRRSGHGGDPTEAGGRTSPTPRLRFSHNRVCKSSCGLSLAPVRPNRATKRRACSRVRSTPDGLPLAQRVEQRSQPRAGLPAERRRPPRRRPAGAAAAPGRPAGSAGPSSRGPAPGGGRSPTGACAARGSPGGRPPTAR